MSKQRPRIIDGHAHLASTHTIPHEFIRGVAANMAAAAAGRLALSEAAISDILLAQHQDHQADALVAQMDRAGIESTVLLAPDFTHALECELSVEQLASFHDAVRRRHPGRFHVFQGVDPRGGARALRLLEKAVLVYGFEGLKLYPPCGYSPSDESLWPIYEFCRTYGLPVLLHTGPTSPVLPFTFSHPMAVDHAARTFPDVNFIVAHGGVNYCEDALLLCAYRPNVFLDISGFPSVLSAEGWVPHLKRLFSLNLSHKIIFGTDWPLIGLSDTLEGYVTKMLAEDGPMAELTSEQIDLVMSGNIRRLMPVAGADEMGHRQLM